MTLFVSAKGTFLQRHNATHRRIGAIGTSSSELSLRTQDSEDDVAQNTIAEEQDDEGFLTATMHEAPAAYHIDFSAIFYVGAIS